VSKIAPLEVLLRPANADEVPLLQALERDAAQAFRQVPGHGFVADLPARDAVEHALVRDRGTALVLDASAVGGDIVGFALLLPVDARAHLFEAAVALSLQGRGLGRRLLAGAESWAAARGFCELTLTTYRDVPWNRPFYERLGFGTFEPGPDRPELGALMREEAQSGYARQLRVAMRKAI
jgi:GNAT superfamily N-acetyltransferase